MKRITTSFMVILLTFICSLSTKAQSVDPTTAWWAGENFNSYTAGTTAPAWNFIAGNGSSAATTFCWYKTVAKNAGITYGNVLSITSPEGTSAFGEPNANRQLEVEKTFSNNLTGYVYATYSGYTCTRGTAYTFINSDGNAVFGVSGQNASATLRYQLTKPTSDGTYLTGTYTAFSPSTGNVRGGWFRVEMLLNLTGTTKEVVKMKTTVGTTVQTYGPITLTNGGNISKFHVITGKYNAIGLDSISIGNLLADDISTLTGDAELQTLSSQVDKTFSVKALASITSLSVSNIEIAGGGSDINWSISDYGTLSEQDKALVSINRNTTNHAEATLSTTGIITSDATITIQAKLGASGTTLTKQVTLKAATIEGLKSALSGEITTSNGLITAVTDSNPYITNAKNTLQGVTTSSQAVVDNTSATSNDIITAIGNQQSAKNSFTATMSPYNTYRSYISTVTAGRDTVGTNYPSAAFFPAIKATLNTAVGIATAARDTISVAGGITNAQTALSTAYTQFNNDRPVFYALGAQIGTTQARYNIANLRKGDTKFLQFPTANVNDLGTAISTAQSSLNTATTTGEISTATTTLATALTTFNGLSRIAPSTNYYRIYTYGVDGGDAATTPVKSILFAHTNRTTSVVSLNYSPMANATLLALGDSALWTITAGATASSYILQNKATGQYLSGTGFSATSVEFTMPETKSGTGTIQFPGDPNFIYAIVNSALKALEVDTWTSPYGAFTNTSGVAERYRFCYQFEEALTPVISTTESSLPVFAATVGTPVNKTLSLSGSNLYGTMTLSVTGANAGLFTVSPATFEVTNTYLSNSTVTVTYTPTAATTTNDVATLSIGIAGGNTLTYNLEGQATVATDINSPENTMKVYSVDNRLIVNGVNNYEVYNLQGMKIIDVKNINANTSTILNKGIYFVKSNDNVQKVCIK